jgi:predicted nucleic acid-binding protein
MRSIFADTHYWVATAKPNDPWGPAAKRAKEQVGNVLLVTTDEVLTEFLAILGKFGPTLRKAAGKMVRAILENPNVKVVPQARESFLAGLELYEAREDKDYSLTDCISMNAMKALSITDVLTNDHHFEQEGFAVLIREAHA